jgi:hypothetical protein
MSKTSALDAPARKVDPRHVGHKPPHEKQEKVPVPGKESQMNPKPDHGEESYRGLGRLKDKVALITGSDSGIGRATAIAYAREGADVCIGYLNEEEDARETERWVKEAGRKALLLPGDVRDEEHCRQMIEQTFKQFGKLDVLINNAAFQMTHESIEEFSTEEFDRTFKNQRLRDVLALQVRHTAHGAGERHHQHSVYSKFRPEPESTCLCVHKRRNCEFHQRLGEDGFKAGHSSKRRGAGAGVDPANPEYDAGREGQEIRLGYRLRAGGAAP